MEELTKAALYARVSSDDQAMRGSIDNQTTALRNAAPHWGMTIVDEYLDDGYSGSLPLDKRPEGLRLSEDAKVVKFDIVLFYKIDRLARSLRNFLDIVDFFEGLGIGLRSMSESFDNSNPMGKFAVHMIAAVAEMERGVIQERTTMGRNRIAAEGRWTWRNTLRLLNRYQRAPNPQHYTQARISGYRDRTNPTHFPYGGR